jgi:stage II sporulation protein D
MPIHAKMLTRKLTAACVIALGCAFPAVSHAATPAKASGTFQVSGAGFGHGIGMSQYGAMGFAEHGWNYQGILGHYYQDTSLARVPNSTVTVLIRQGAATFRGASSANGVRLRASRSYGVLVSHGKLELISGGRRAGIFSAPLKVSGSDLSVTGSGRYAGSLEFEPAPGGSGVLTVNAVDLEDYVRGVVTEESPASWPEEALEAQAVAARTYVLADAPASSEYQVYADTRSQVYGGLSGESSSGNAAVSDTAGQVVESGGRVIPTYFFSSSGGHTEDIQDVWLGTTPVSYLTGVSDPYDDAADDPYYRWSDKLSLATAASRLAGLYKGSFEGVKVLKHGTSPRIVAASVIGTKGASTVAGTTLQDDLGTMSTWMSFTTVTAHGSVSSGSGTGSGSGNGTGSGAKQTAPASGGSSASGSAGSAAGSSSGGAGIGAAVRARSARSRGDDAAQSAGAARSAGAVRVLSGTVLPVVRGARVTVQRRTGEHWVTAGSTTVSATGAYVVRGLAAGTYRAVYRGAAAPSATLR